MAENKQSIRRLLRQTRVEIAPETFFLISLSHETWLKLLENPELSPRMSAPFMIFKDRRETTLLLDEIDFKVMKSSLGDAKVEGNFRLMTFDVELNFSVIGFLAEITRIFAEAQISVMAVSAFSRDHLLIKQENLSQALRALSPNVNEIC